MNDNYDQYLLSEITAVAVLSCILTVLSIVIICFGVGYFRNKKRNHAIICGIVTVILIAACVFSFFYMAPYISDVKHRSYIRYDGEFIVGDGDYDPRSGSNPRVTFSHGGECERYQVRGRTNLSDGVHEGYVVYSERSKMIVEWYCEDCGG